MPDDFSTRALRMLLLPLSPAALEESKGAQLLHDRLAAMDIVGEDRLSWVQMQLNSWEDLGEPSQELRRIVQDALAAGGGPEGRRIANGYFGSHSKLMRDRLFTHEEARWLLSHASLILRLAESERFSAAQIARIIGKRDERARFSRQSVEIILNALQVSRQVTEEEIKTLIKSDKASEGKTFADSSLQESAESVGRTSSALGYGSDIAGSLMILAGDGDLPAQIPYLQMLHYQCSIAEHFDHALTDLYEFSPRGIAAITLFESFGNLASAGNPFLNNAKSVEQMSAAWVRSKKKNELQSAAALYDIVENLERLGFSARREVARLIRLWIHRLVRLRLDARLPDIPPLNNKEWRTLLDFAARRNTGTFGILEQRIVDAVASKLHCRDAGWRVRGVGASVNATNLSERKLGDCDFQKIESAEIRAYESHGGRLSSVYVAEHLRTLRKVSGYRASELEAIHDLDRWNIKICFVAHEIRLSKPLIKEVPIGNMVASFEFQEFSSFIEPFSNLTDEDVSLLNRLVLDPINAPNTPEGVRQVIRSLLPI